MDSIRTTIPKRDRRAGLLSALSLLAVLSLTALPAHAGKAHAHGVAQMTVSLEGARLSVGLEMPLDSLVGHERAPRTEAERTAARAALERLRDGATLLRPEAGAGCRLVQAQVDAPVLEQGAAAAGGHADALASYAFDCADPARLNTLEVNLHEAFRRLERVEVQFVTPGAQGRLVLRKPAKTVRLGR